MQTNRVGGLMEKGWVQVAATKMEKNSFLPKSWVNRKQPRKYSDMPKHALAGTSKVHQPLKPLRTVATFSAVGL